MLIVISPAKTVDFETPPSTSKFTTPEFLQQSKKLVGEMKKYDTRTLKSLMKVSDKIAELNVARFKKFSAPFTPMNAKQAILAFKGDVYTELDSETFKAADLGFAQKHLRILSGLYGILRPLDLMQAYRLEMGTRLVTKSFNNLYEFWDDRITDHINKQLKKQKSASLINLASNEYFKVVKPKLINGQIITPAFKEARDGDYKMIGLYAKKARGMMSRYIIQNRIEDLQDIKSFTLQGYKYNKKLSSDNNWVFTRKTK